MITSDQKELEYLRNKFGETAKFSKFKRSRINSNWLVSDGSSEIVVRFYPAFFVDKLSTEVMVLNAVANCGNGIPQLLGADSTHFERPVLFLSRLIGSPVADCSQQLETMNASNLIADLQNLLRRVAAVPVENIGYLHDPSDCFTLYEYAGKMATKQMDVISKADLLPLGVRIRIMDNMAKLPAILSGNKPQFTYPDLSSGNILIEKGKLSGLIDWEFAMGFNPVYGFANLLLEQISGIEAQWIAVTDLLDCFPGQQEEILLLAMLRAVELVGYLPTTVVYSELQRKDLLAAFSVGVNDILDLLESR
ncbi:MAG: aminoglycoside phosphotransferase family protein [Candidatus Peribacteraceae bacterium]|jgi:aminoglycoside phosphotransferase (APT) family kinase protein